jgi:hypothetical protein
MKKSLYLIGVVALLAIGAFGQYAWTTHAAMAQSPAIESVPTQDMMLAAQEGHGGMMMGADKKGGSGNMSGMSGCGMGGGSGGMGGMMGDMKGGMMGCPMMAKAKDGKGMSGCCCANMMETGKEKPKKPA